MDHTISIRSGTGRTDGSSPVGSHSKGGGFSKVPETRIKRTLLLNAYPIMYIILSIPGIANRIAEAAGYEVLWLAILQASTQFVGLANAITYGINENIWRQLKEKFQRSKVI